MTNDFWRFQKPTEDKLNFEDSCQRQAHLNPSQQNFASLQRWIFQSLQLSFFFTGGNEKKKNNQRLF